MGRLYKALVCNYTPPLRLQCNIFHFAFCIWCVKTTNRYFGAPELNYGRIGLPPVFVLHTLGMG